MAWTGEKEYRAALEWVLYYGGEPSVHVLIAVMSDITPPVELSMYDVHPVIAKEFGECVRLLDAVPAWRDGFKAKIAKCYPKWEPVTRRWATLEKIYRVDYNTIPRDMSRTEAALVESYEKARETVEA